MSEIQNEWKTQRSAQSLGGNFGIYLQVQVLLF